MIKGIEYFYDVFFYYFAFGIPITLILKRYYESKIDNSNVREKVMTADLTLEDLRVKMEDIQARMMAKGI